MRVDHRRSGRDDNMLRAPEPAWPRVASVAIADVRFPVALKDSCQDMPSAVSKKIKQQSL
jgi:hypothetical protein